jgi:hypothetical protein
MFNRCISTGFNNVALRDTIAATGGVPASVQNSGGTVKGRKDNLKPWKPGQSGNPGGRPKRDLAAEIARAIFEQEPEAITRVFAAELKKGNAKVFAALADRAYGKPRQQIEHLGEDGGPVQASVVVQFVSTGKEGA